MKPSNWYAPRECLFSCVQGGEKTGNIHRDICFYVMGGNKKSGSLWDNVFCVLHGSLNGNSQEPNFNFFLFGKEAVNNILATNPLFYFWLKAFRIFSKVQGNPEKRKLHNSKSEVEAISHPERKA